MSALESYLKEILDGASDAIYVTDRGHRILYANQMARTIGKCQLHTEMIGEKCYKALLGRDEPCPFCKMEQLSMEDYLVREFSGISGKVLELKGKLLNWEGTEAHIEYIHDITAQKQAESRSEELFIQQKNLYEHIGIGMCLYRYKNGEFRALVCNDTYRQLFHLPAEFDAGEPLTLRTEDFLEEPEELKASLVGHIREGRPFHRVCQLKDKKTSLPRSVLINMECAPQETGDALWYVSAYDVTEWTENETKLNNILNNISGGIAVYQIGKDGKVRRLMFTDGLCGMQGYTREEYERLGAGDVMFLVHEEDRERLRDALRESSREQSAFSVTYRVIHKKHGYIWVNLTATPIGRDSEGCLRYNAAFTNISQPFDLYRQMLDNSENGLLVTDENTREVYFTNKAARSILDSARRVCTSEKCGHDPAQGLILCSDCRLLPGKENSMRKVESNGRTYQVYTHPMKWMHRPALIQYFSDITEEILLQNRLVSDEERYRLVVEKSGMALIDYDLKSGDVYMNERFRGYAASSSSNIREFFDHKAGSVTVHPQDGSDLERFYRDLEIHYEAAARMRLKMQNGDYRWTEMNALELHDETGGILRKIGFFRDVDAVTRQYEDMKIRYDYEMARQNSFENGVVERMLLDLTDNKIIQAANPRTASLTRLIGMSMDDLLEARLAHTYGEKERAELAGFMNRDALLQAYYTGEDPTLEMRTLVPQTGEKKYFLSYAQMAKNPGNGHIIAFIETRDCDQAKMESTLMRRLLETNYESAIVIDASTGKIKIGVAAGRKDFTTDIGKTYDELVGEEIIRYVVEEEQEQTKDQMSLAMIREKLKSTELYSGRVALEIEGELSYKMWTAVYFDEEREYILLTIANVTEVYKRDLETARELKEALENANVASRAKNTFLARMSHEIRTPITTVSGILDLIHMACRKNEIRVEELLAQIDTADAANQYLLTLVNDILDISKIENNEMRLSPAATDIQEIVDSLCSMAEPLAAKKDIRFILERKICTDRWYQVDGVRLQQILMNLLNNAIKFTPEGGTVRFTMKQGQVKGTEALVSFVVRDTGVGISDDFKQDVFEPFRQEYTDSRKGYGGTGIGLSISRQLARMMGGDITFESEKGKGSTFVVELRLEAVPPERDEKTPAQETGAPRLDGIHVLLCEDNEINQMIVAQILEAGGCRVTSAGNGRQAVELFAESGPGTFDFILMDVQMPEMDGLEATRQIRTLDRVDAGTVPIVAMSANAYEEDRQMSLEAGMNEHMSKPVDTALLYQTIARYCGRDRAAGVKEKWGYGTKTEACDRGG